MDSPSPPPPCGALCVLQYGFQVDPFGASSWWALLSAKMGFKGHLVARLNYYDKGWMQANQALEFIWRPSPSLYRSSGVEIFTHIMDQVSPRYKFLKSLNSGAYFGPFHAYRGSVQSGPACRG